MSPQVGDEGVDTISVNVSDGNNAAVGETFTVTVTAAPSEDDFITLGASSQQSGGTSSISFPHNLSSNSNRAVVVGVSIEANGNVGRTISITYGGVVMHPIPDSFALIKPGSYAMSTELFYLLEAELPNSGNQAILISHDGSDVNAGALQLNGVKQAAPDAAATSAVSSPSTISTNITTLSNNALLLDVIGGGHPEGRASLQPATDQTTYWGSSAPSSQGHGSTRQVGAAGSYNQQWSASSLNRAAHSVVAFAPAASGSPVNQPPVLNAIGDQSLREGSSQSITISATDADGDALVFSSTALPSYATFVDNGDDTATLNLAPQAADIGTSSLTISVTDGENDSVSETITIDVTAVPVNVVPVLSSIGDQTLQEGTSQSITVTATDGNGDALTFSSTTLPSYAIFTDNGNNTATFALQPQVGDAGIATISISVTDGLSPEVTETITVEIRVTPPVDQGVLINEVLAGNENTNYDTDHYQFSDWIELHNNTNQSINISGYYLSDDPAEPEMWQVPSNTVISAGGYLVVWADKTDQKDNELHTNFKLSAKGETVILADQNGVVVDTLTYSKLDTDISVSKVGGEIVYMTPTPGVANATSLSTSDRSADPTLSVDEGFYASAQTIVLAQENGGQIYFTTDGSIPTTASTLYTQAIQASATTVIRAIAYEGGKLPSKVSTNTYFIAEESAPPMITTLPLISISMNPDHLGDSAVGESSVADLLGIYARGTNGTYGINCDADDTPSKYANWNQSWDRPVNIEYFDKDNIKTFEFGADISISGQCSRYNKRKSFAIELDSKYGTKSLKYALYESKPDVKKIKDFKIRAGNGNDVLSTLLAKSGGFNVDYQAHQAVRFFLNGEYWGVYYLREKKGKDFLNSNYPDIDEDNTDIIAYNLHGYVEKAGDSTIFDNGIKEFINDSDNDISTEADYQTVLSMIDEDNFIDYMVVMIYSSNRDWIFNNNRWWREKIDGAKWRFMLDDLDSGFKNSDFDSFAFLKFSRPIFVSKLFDELMKNSTFKQKFISRFNDQLDTVFQPDNVSER